MKNTSVNQNFTKTNFNKINNNNLNIIKNK